MHHSSSSGGYLILCSVGLVKDRDDKKRSEAMICPRHGSSVCSPKYSLVTAEILATYMHSEPGFMGFCPVVYRLSEWTFDNESLRHSALKIR